MEQIVTLTKLKEEIKENQKQVLDIDYIAKRLSDYQKEMQKEENRFWKKLIFDWINATEEYVELQEGSRIYEWLYPIKFNKLSALIMEELNWNIDIVINEGEEILEHIYTKMKLTKESFFEELMKIRILLINKERVKICRDGKVIIIREM